MILLLFILVLGILIVVHEAGHFLTAKRSGVRVDEFALGFGPQLYAKKIGDTVYKVCAIPLGGYVKMAGDERDKCEGRSDEYFSKSPGVRSLIVLMGPIVNYVFAYLCFVVVFMVGLVDMDKALQAEPARIGVVVAESPAFKAGIKTGDIIRSIDGEEVGNWTTMQETIATSGGKEMAITVDRDGKTLFLTVKPEVTTTQDIFTKEHSVSRIGVGSAPLKNIKAKFIERYGFVGSLRRAAVELWDVTERTYEALWQIVIGERSAKEGVTGLIGIYFIFKAAAGLGFAFFLNIVAVVSASLAIFNLLPLIPLDGGHLALIGIEKLRGRPLSMRADDLVNKIGFVLIILLAIFVFYIDLERTGFFSKILAFFK